MCPNTMTKMQSFIPTWILSIPNDSGCSFRTVTAFKFICRQLNIWVRPVSVSVLIPQTSRVVQEKL